MALIKCRECGTEISNQAAACVKCGAPVKSAISAAPKGKMGCGTVIAAAVGLVVLVSVLGSLSNAGKTTESKAAAETCGKDDLSCLGNKGVVGAGIYCKDPIERLAKHSVKWTDGTFDMKFSRFRWSDEKNGVITFIGDKAEFQNGFGAFTPVIYECDLAADNKTVLDVRVDEGRLPQ